MNTDVGVIGLGRMGAAMAGRLLDCGARVRVYNRSPSACQPLVARGALSSLTPGGVAGPGGLVISMLNDEQAVEAVCGGPEGLLGHLRGGTHVSMSTLAPEAARRMAAAHADAGITYISAPVQGRPGMAASGQLVAWVSGPASAAADPALGALCRKVVHLGGDAGLAPAAKLAVNFLMFGNLALFAEALAYVSRQGVAREVFAGGVTDTLFSAPFFQAVAAALCSPNEAAQGSDVAIACKDLGLLLASEQQPELLPVAAEVHSLYRRAVERGLADLDPIAIRRLFDPSE